MPFKHKPWLYVLIGLLCIVSVLSFTWYSLTHKEHGENCASVSWLPASATNVSYFKSYPNTAYEFDISEDEFIRWSKWDLKPIEEPVVVSRYNRFTTKIPPNPGANATIEEYEAYQKTIESTYSKISEGLYYRYLDQSDGGGIVVAYDRKNGRAYFRSNPR